MAVGRAGLIAGLVLVIAGCGAEDPFPQRPPIDVIEITSRTTEFQRALLADGIVTFAEYEKATLAAISCIEAGGIPGVYVDGPNPRSGDERFLDWSVAWNGQVGEQEYRELQDRISVLNERCQREFQLDVSRVWEYQNLLRSGQREQWKPKVIECLQAAGAKLDTKASYEDIFRAVAEGSENDAVRDCHKRFAQFFVVGVE